MKPQSKQNPRVWSLTPMAEEQVTGGFGDEESSGVLLYYKYAPIPDLSALAHFYESNCQSLGLLGRVRIAPDGVNVTVGGKMASLQQHIAAASSDSLFDGTDFKLASCDDPSDHRVAEECGFTSLSVRVVKELVTFRSNSISKSPAISYAGKHLSATEFHSVLHDAGNSLDSSGVPVESKGLLLLDARNVYETRIGKFQSPSVETLDPGIRQYSDLAAWIDEHSERLRDKHVLMYCTGGIRCEMASAYIRSKGAGYENVFQLFGGIQRYLEQFPGGGYFKGKNFVFDHRISVGSQDTDIVGACLICSSQFDDYSSRCRCIYCRMLVLVCNSCQCKYTSGYVCELCQKHGKGGRLLAEVLDNTLDAEFCPDSPGQAETQSSFHLIAPSSEVSRGYGSNPHRKLRILCLHGFRQTASSFKGRTSSLAKKLKNMVEFVFVDAPHELPFIYQLRFSEENHCLSPQLETDSNSGIQQPLLPAENCKKKFAWLIAPKSNCSQEPGWKIADEPFDPLQYQKQTDGFEDSYAYLKSVIAKMGPFDGVLGFSQGAAMSALFFEEQQRSSDILDIRFAILCSGYAALSGKFRGFLHYPSLHIFGDGRGHDSQIGTQASMELVELFDKGCSMVVEHDMGHIIPTRSPYIDQIKSFLVRFL